MKLGLCGNISLECLAAELDRSMPEATIVVGRSGGFKAELSAPFGDFTTLDICIIALDWRDLAPALYCFAWGDDAVAVTSGFRDLCGGIKEAIGKFRAVSTAKVLVFSPVSESRGPAGFINRLLQPSPSELSAACQNIFNEMCRSVSDVYPVDVEELSALTGKDHAFDPVSRFHTQQPFSSAMTRAIAGHISALCVQFAKYPLKCMVLDCDDTLWGGIVGESGAENIVLSDKGPGLAYRCFQQEIVRLHKQGMILAVCSKNNTCDVLEVMEKHPHMLIRPSMISCFRINWDDKPKNMLQISAELNIGLGALMFVDDSPSERGMMTAALPEVTVLDLPADPAYFGEALSKCTRFWPLQLTKDDSVKGAFFLQEKNRRESRELSANLEEYLVKSEISVAISRTGVDDPSLPRIAQLFNKTNQFNLTTQRMSETELSASMRDPHNALFALSMKDIYGDYGIIAAALVKGNTIDSFLLSCRAFGKRVENAFAVYLLQFLKENGRALAFGRYVQSQRNSMTREFYPDLGFVPEKTIGDETRWRYNLETPLPASPRWIAIRIGNS
jgi:FkbH-like protein